jgi:hypothetical protein
LVVTITLPTIGCLGITSIVGTPFLWWVSDRRPCGDRSFLEEGENAFFSGIWEFWLLGLGLDPLRSNSCCVVLLRNWIKPS